MQVISAHNLPKPLGSGAKGEVIDPYVVLELHGVPADCAEQRTRTAAQNQDDPLFDETFEFQVRHFITVYPGAGLFLCTSMCICLFWWIVQYTDIVKQGQCSACGTKVGGYCWLSFYSFGDQVGVVGIDRPCDTVLSMAQRSLNALL